MSSTRSAIVGIASLCGLAAAACGFDGTGGLEQTVSPAEPGPPLPGPSVPPGPAPPAPDSGPGPSTPVAPCSEPTLAFDGVDDVATVADDSDLDLRGDFTVEAWIKPGAKVAGGLEMDIVSHHDATDTRGWVLLVKEGRVEIVVWGAENFAGKGYSAGNVGAPYVVAGKWAHVAGTLEGNSLRIYYDGVLRDSQELGTFFIRESYSGALRLGRAAYVEDFRFHGELDDVRLSGLARYTGAAAPRPTTPLSVDDATVASWRFDEPLGDKLLDGSKNRHDGSVAPDPTAPVRLMSTCVADR